MSNATPAPAVNSSTVPKQLKPFVKGDARINRRGRPKSFEQLRKSILVFLAEQADDASGTRLDVILRELAANDPKVLLEYGFGKVPAAVAVTARIEEKPLKMYVNCSPDDWDNQPEPSPRPVL